MEIHEKHESGAQFLENLAHLAPGYHGYKERECRREEDCRFRLRLLQQLAQLRDRIANRIGGASDRPVPPTLDAIDLRARRLDNIADAIRYAPYGFSGFFDASAVAEASLDRILEADLLLIEDLNAIERLLDHCPAPATFGPRTQAFLQHLDGAIEHLERHLVMRDKVLGDA